MSDCREPEAQADDDSPLFDAALSLLACGAPVALGVSLEKAPGQPTSILPTGAPFLSLLGLVPHASALFDLRLRFSFGAALSDR